MFGLTWAVLDCTEHTSLDDFGTSILVQEEGDDYFNNGIAKAKGEVRSTTKH